jgi:hypothetical protein
MVIFVLFYVENRNTVVSPVIRPLPTMATPLIKSDSGLFAHILKMYTLTLWMISRIFSHILKQSYFNNIESGE